MPGTHIKFINYIEAHQDLDVKELNLSQLEMLRDLVDLASSEVHEEIAKRIQKNATYKNR